jgi:hypothetical protein
MYDLLPIIIKTVIQCIKNKTQKQQINLQEFVPNWDKPHSTKWAFLEKIVELFHPTLNAIKLLEGDEYITQSLILLQIIQIEKQVGILSQKCKIILFFLSSSLSSFIL